MRKSCTLLVLSLSMMACFPGPASPGGDAPAGPQARQDALQQLADWSGMDWRVRNEPTYHTAAFLEGQTASLGPPDQASTLARLFVMRFAALFGLSPDDQVEHVSATVDGLGMRHVRLAQRRGGVPVFDGTLTVHLDAQGAVRRVHGFTVPLSGLSAGDTTPALSDDQARDRALSLAQDELPTASLSALTPDLYLLPDPSGIRLAFRVEVYGQDPDLPVRRELFIDAKTGTLVREGDLVARLSLPQPAKGSGMGALGDSYQLDITLSGQTYSLQDQGRGKQHTESIKPGQRLPGTIVTSKAPDQWDPEAVDVHAHLAAVWDYFAQVHKYFGWTGNGAGIIAVTHFGGPPIIGLFDGRHVLFGGGDGGDLLPPGAALDVVAHEYTHAVVRSLAQLDPVGETAALDEGLADLFACLIEQAAQPDHGNWTIGEAIYRPGGVMTPIRDLSDPGAASMNRAAYAGYQLAQRIGDDRTAAIWYRAVSTYLRRGAGFSDAADATLAAARDLHGPDSAEVVSVLEAWRAAGVGSIGTIGEMAHAMK